MWQRFLGRDDVYQQVWSGNGRIDGLVLGVPVELKIIKNGDLEKVVEDSLPQATQYVVTQGRRAGFLVILDLRKHTAPTPTICDDVSVRLGQTGEGLDPSPLGETAVGICIVRAHLTVPSALKPS